MGVEIERKFLLAGDAWRAGVVRSQRFVQGYLTRPGGAQPPACSVRVRIGGEAAWLNVKSALAGVERLEYEYPIPRGDAEQMLHRFCRGVVEKIRHDVPYAGVTFEIDEFAGDNAGLIVAEVELASADAQFARPAWLGREVSDRRRYYNLHLVDYPYSRWSAQERNGD
jgi:adenylate cyclase